MRFTRAVFSLKSRWKGSPDPRKHYDAHLPRSRPLVLTVVGGTLPTYWSNYITIPVRTSSLETSRPKRPRLFNLVSV